MLSMVQKEPIILDGKRVENILVLADRFQLPAAARQVGLLVAQSTMDKQKKLILADKYKLDILLDHAMALYNKVSDFKTMYEVSKNFSEKSKAYIHDKFFKKFGAHLD